MIVEEYHCYQLCTEVFQIFFPEIALQMYVIDDYNKSLDLVGVGQLRNIYLHSCTGEKMAQDISYVWMNCTWLLQLTVSAVMLALSMVYRACSIPKIFFSMLFFIYSARVLLPLCYKWYGKQLLVYFHHFISYELRWQKRLSYIAWPAKEVISQLFYW
jgi:hypothetical protein